VFLHYLSEEKLSNIDMLDNQYWFLSLILKFLQKCTRRKCEKRVAVWHHTYF